MERGRRDSLPDADEEYGTASLIGTRPATGAIKQDADDDDGNDEEKDIKYQRSHFRTKISANYRSKGVHCNSSTSVFNHAFGCR
jgi:hypothetical protein